jgi:hypothetical protein
VAVPKLEALLFRCPDAIQRAYGSIPPGLLERGQTSPSTALSELDDAAQAYMNIADALDDNDVTALRSEPPVRELLAFVDELQRDGVLTIVGS